MILEEAQVIQADADWIIVNVIKTSSCNSCHANGACGTASLSRFFNFRSPRLKVRNTLSAVCGDRVMLGIEDHFMLKGSMLLYLMPLLGLLIFAGLAELLINPTNTNTSELFTILAGLFGLIGGLWLARQMAANMLNEEAVKLHEVINHKPQIITFTK